MRFNLVKTVDAIVDADLPWLGSHEKLVGVVLARHANPECIAHPSQETMAKKASCSERTVWKALKVLEQHGVILVVQAGRQHYSTRYSLEHTIAVLRAACDAAQKELSAAPDANLDDVSPASDASLTDPQSRNGGSPESQTEPPRVAPRAAEGTEGIREEGTETPLPPEGSRTGSTYVDAISTAYAEGISSVTKSPFPYERFSERVRVAEIVDQVAPKELRGTELVAWTKRHAIAYAASRSENPRFENGFSPAKFGQWFRAGNAAPPPRPVAPARPKRTEPEEPPMTQAETVAAAEKALAALDGVGFGGFGGGT